MDRIESFISRNVEPAQEGVGLAIAGVTAAAIAAAIAKAKADAVIQQKRIKRYEKEKAAGNVSEKTMAKASRVIKGGMPYPDYVETIKYYQARESAVQKLFSKYQGLIKSDLEKLTANGKFKGLPSIAHPYSWDDSYFDKEWNYQEVRIYYALDYEAIYECLEDGNDTDDSKVPDDMHSVMNTDDLKASQSMTLKVLREYCSAVDSTIQKRINELNAGLHRIGLNSSASVDSNPDVVYKEYGCSIKFEKHS